MTKSIVGMLLLSFTASATSTELKEILSSRTLTHFQIHRLKNRQSEILTAACRAQLRREQIPSACAKARAAGLKILIPDAVWQNSCRTASVERMSFAALQQALKLRSWDAGCLTFLRQSFKRKIYQSIESDAGPQVGLDLEMSALHAKDSQTPGADL